MNNYKLNKAQRKAIKYFEKGYNIFITGPGGTGKSFCIKYIRENYPDKNIAVTATTGISAVLLEGQTLHSWAAICFGEDTAEWIHSKMNKTQRLRWIKTDVLIIDEISLLTPELFEKLEYLARLTRKNNEPFGGLQIVLSGDFLQLPCINSKKFCFESPLWNTILRKIVYFHKIHRQSNTEFQNALNYLRLGRVTNPIKKMLRSRKNVDLKNDYGILPTKLFSLNSDVEAINKKELLKLKKETNAHLYTYVATVKMPPKIKKLIKMRKNKINYIADVFKDVSAIRQLDLVIGSQVMLLKNLDTEMGLANGSRGVIVDFKASSNDFELYPVVQFLNGDIRTIKNHTWEIKRNNSNYSITQLPLRLAYAITIHKSQGSSLDYVEVDMNGIFQCSQAYVALSRVKTLEGLSIKNLDIYKFVVHPKALQFYIRLYKASERKNKKKLKKN